MTGHELVALATPSILAAIAAIFSAIGNYLSHNTVKETKDRVIQLEVNTNHNLEELKEAIRASALLQGEAIGRAKEKASALAAATAAVTEEKPK